jgi:hypothetical protein
LTEVSDDALVTNDEGETAPALAATDAPPHRRASATPAVAVTLPEAGLDRRAAAGPTGLPTAGLTARPRRLALRPAGPIVVVRPPRPCRIDFEGCTGTEAARVEVRAWLDRLGDLTAALTGAEVVIESIFEPRKERLYRVRMRLTMRAAVVAVAPDHPNNGPHEDIFCAIRNGFRAARRQLESYQKEHPAAAEADPPVTPVPPVSGA